MCVYITCGRDPYESLSFARAHARAHAYPRVRTHTVSYAAGDSRQNGTSGKAHCRTDFIAGISQGIDGPGGMCLSQLSLPPGKTPTRTLTSEHLSTHASKRLYECTHTHRCTRNACMPQTHTLRGASALIHLFFSKFPRAFAVSVPVEQRALDKTYS